MNKKTVLLVDDEEMILRFMEDLLESNGYVVFAANSCMQAFEILDQHPIAVIICDELMPDLPGTDFLNTIKETRSHIVRLLMSAHTEFDLLKNGVNQTHIFKFIPKPLNKDDVLKAVKESFLYYQDLIEKDRKSRILDNAFEGILITNLENIIESVNISFLLLTGFAKEEVIGENVWEIFAHFSSEEKRDITDALSAYHVWQGETNLSMQNEEKVSGLLAISEIVADVSFGYRTFSFLNMPELKQKEYQIAYLNRIDHETELLNRKGFVDALASLMQPAQKTTSPLYLVIFYFDKLTTHSNILGETFSKEIALQISSRLNSSISLGSLCGRITQNAFAITLNLSTQEELLKELQILKNQFYPPLVINQESYYIKPILGIGTYPGDANDATQLVDTALLCAEYAQQNSLDEVFYSSELERQLKNQMYFESEIVNLIHRQGYNIVYQPQFNDSAKITGFTASISIPAPMDRIISAKLFYEIATQLNILASVQRKMIFDAMSQVRDWQKMFHQPFHLKLDLSMQFINQKDFLEYIDSLLHRMEMSAASLFVGITQKDYLNYPRLHPYLTELKQMGITLILTELTYPFWVLEHAREVPFTWIELNNNFMKPNETTSGKDYYAYLIGLLKQMGFKCIGSMLSTPADQIRAKTLGCDLLQGELLCPPTPAITIRRFITDNNPASNYSQK